ncbi:MAG: hypothetical protein JRG86_05615, partial [Deltaproteobacteria bacterium]|nr:hypothetical protein [Deltaproteobacteria bacterium]
FEALEATRLINALTQAISFRPIEKQQLLEANTVRSRFEIMIDLLRFRLAELGATAPSSTSRPH